MDNVFRTRVDSCCMYSVTLYYKSYRLLFQEDETMEFALLRCGNPNCKNPPFTSEKFLVNRLTLAIRKNIQQYYAVGLVKTTTMNLLTKVFNLNTLRDGLFVRIEAVRQGLGGYH